MSQASPRQCYSELNDLLQRQIDEIRGLYACLADIKSAIVEGDPDRMNHLVGQQQHRVEKIECLDSRRRDLLARHGFQYEKEDLLSCIDWCDEDSMLADLYRQYEKSLNELQRSLRVNSLLVNKGRKRIRQSLYLLTGQDASNQSATYSATGIAEETRNLRTLARA